MTVVGHSFITTSIHFFTHVILKKLIEVAVCNVLWQISARDDNKPGVWISCCCGRMCGCKLPTGGLFMTVSSAGRGNDRRVSSGCTACCGHDMSSSAKIACISLSICFRSAAAAATITMPTILSSLTQHLNAELTQSHKYLAAVGTLKTIKLSLVTNYL